ncbi:MAG: radical SAM protein [Spirochaetales bacterium]|nr:radical SAM protein [Spirochaetales bacterium]
MDCLIIGYNEKKLKHVKSIIKLIEALKLPQLFKTFPINSELYMLYKAIYYSWIRYKNEPLSIDNIVEEYYLGNGPMKKKSNAIFSPTIAYLGTYLNRRGFTFDYVNSFNEEKEELSEKLKNEDLLTVAISTTFYQQVEPIKEIVDFIKKYNRKVKIIAGGPYILNQVQGLPRRSLKRFLNTINADFYVVNIQGETALTEILRAIKGNLPYDQIKNIIYKDHNQYKRNEFEPEKNKIEENTIDWSLFSSSITPLQIVRTCVSCQFSCAFCDFHKIGGKYQAMSVEAVEKELDMIYNTGRVKYLLFTDDTFNFPVKRFKEILKLMIRKKYNFKWYSFLRCQFLDSETMELMKESNCDGVLLGTESGSQKILDNMNKEATVEGYIKGLDLLNKYNIYNCASFIIGFPGETEETARETIDFIEKYRPNFYRMSTWVCLPASPIYKQKDKYKIKGEGHVWSHATMDAKTAARIIDDAIMNIKNSFYAPIFDFDSLAYYNWGMNQDQVADMQIAFDAGVKEKLRDPGKRSVSIEIYNKLKQAAMSQSIQ